MSVSKSLLNFVSKRCLVQTQVNRPTTPLPAEISVAVALYRLPLMAPPMSETERKFVDASSEIEMENSLKNDFELKLEVDTVLLAKRAKLEAEGKDLSQLDGEIGVSNMQKMKDWKVLGNERIEKFGLNADFHACTQPPTTFHRKLDRKLVLLVRERFPTADERYISPWILPQLRNSREPLRQTAERCVGDLFTGDVSFRVLGNAPFAHYRYRYPKKIAERLGANSNYIFFFAAEMLSKSALPDMNDRFVAEHRWSTSDEVLDLISLRRYTSKWKSILIE